MNRPEKKNIQFLPPIKRYVNAIEARLALPMRDKVRIMTDISSTISARHEAGDSYEDIMKDMGTPEEVAAQFNEEMAPGRKARSPLRFLPLILAAAACIPALFQVFSGIALVQFFSSVADVGIIGGADGPTSVFITSKGPGTPFDNVLSVLTFAPVALVVCLLGWYLFLARKTRAARVCGMVGVLIWFLTMLIFCFGPFAVDSGQYFLLAPSLLLSLILILVTLRAGKK